MYTMSPRVIIGHSVKVAPYFSCTTLCTLMFIVCYIVNWLIYISMSAEYGSDSPFEPKIIPKMLTFWSQISVLFVLISQQYRGSHHSRRGFLYLSSCVWNKSTRNFTFLSCLFLPGQFCCTLVCAEINTARQVISCRIFFLSKLNQ